MFRLWFSLDKARRSRALGFKFRFLQIQAACMSIALSDIWDCRSLGVGCFSFGGFRVCVNSRPLNNKEDPCLRNLGSRAKL